jgi:hypothetical protein
MSIYLAALVLFFSTGLQGTAPGLKGKPEDNPKTAQSFLSSQKWGDNLPDSQTVYTQVAAGSEGATVRIVPLAGANRISWQSALGKGTTGGNGFFVAKIYNVQNKNVPSLGLKEGAMGYLWIGELNGTEGERGAAIYSVRKDGTIEANPTRLELGGFCEGQHTYSAVRITDGNKCPGAFGSASSATASNRKMIMLASTNMIRTPAIMPPSGSGLWVTCLGGCCEVRVQ